MNTLLSNYTLEKCASIALEIRNQAKTKNKVCKSHHQVLITKDQTKTRG